MQAISVWRIYQRLPSGTLLSGGQSIAALFGLVVIATQALAQSPAPIPDGRIVHGELDVLRAWLAEPTERYPHGVLGDEIEASAMVIESRSGERHHVRLDAGAFEDLTPRLADIDGDGRDEVWTVRSDAVLGARLEAYGLTEHGLALRFATTPIGMGYRWLNPLAVADFDGDGEREAAYVETPHIGGVLTIVHPRGTHLSVVARRPGYSTHAMGSTKLDLAAVANLDGHPGAEIVLPDQSRTRLAVISFTGVRLVERWRSAAGPQVAGALRLKQGSEGWQASYLTSGGASVRLKIPTADFSARKGE